MEGLRISSCLICVFVVLAFLAAKGNSSITCYQCNSLYDPRCGDPFDPYSLGQVNCSMREPFEHVAVKEATICRKIVQKIQGTVRVVRGCGYIENDPPRNEEICMKRSGTHDVQILYCACKGDLCNSVPALTRPSATVALAVSAVAMVAKMLFL